MRALLFERNPARYAAAVVAGRLAPGRGARVGPLRLTEIDPPALPGPGWQSVRPRLSGICGSDLAMVDGRSSRYFEPIVSFPFVPGHEVVGDTEEGARVVVQPVLSCAARGIDPPCPMCVAGRVNLCQRSAFGQLPPGLQTGYCAATGGGWSTQLVSHRSQLHAVPEAMADEAAVLVEPAACAVHAARLLSDEHGRADGVVAVIGAGTLGLMSTAALRRLDRPGGMLVATAKHPGQRRLAHEMGADAVVEPAGLERAVRRATGSLRAGDRLTAGATAVVDCVGSAASLRQALAVVAPGGTVMVVGMPANVSIDLTPLWHREVSLRGCYAYETRDFTGAFDLVQSAELGRLLSATYPLERYREAIGHAAAAGSRGAVKVAFDLRHERNR